MEAGGVFASSVRRACEILLLLGGVAAAFAADPGKAQTTAGPAVQAADRELIPGAENMTTAERDTYRRRMGAAATLEEKAQEFREAGGKTYQKV